MKKTDWTKVIKTIQKEKKTTGHPVHTLTVIEKITGIGTSTLSRLKNGETTILDYDSGFALIKLKDELKAKNKKS